MKNLDTVSGFGIFLKEELERRKDLDSNFSLRKFAAALDIEPSFLSKLIRGTRSVSTFMLDDLGQRMGLSPRQLAQFHRDLHEYKKIQRPQRSDKKSYSFKPISPVKFEQISDWYYFAILELATTESFVFDSMRVSEQLGITRIEARTALNTLKKLGFLCEVKEGKWVVSNGENSALPKKSTTINHQRLQKQFLMKAINALNDVPIEMRDQTGVTIAIPVERVEKMKKLIKSFRKSAAQLAQPTAKKAVVYQLCVSFFPLMSVDGPLNGKEK